MSKLTKKVGFVVDDYKVEKYLEEIKKLNLEFDKTPYMLKGLTLIRVDTPNDLVRTLYNMATKLEFAFSQQKNREN